MNICLKLLDEDIQETENRIWEEHVGPTANTSPREVEAFESI